MAKIRVIILALFVLASFMTGCSNPPGLILTTPWPTDYLPTAVALTMAAFPSVTLYATQIPFLISTDDPQIKTTTPESITDVGSRNPSQTYPYLRTPIPTPTLNKSEAEIQIISPGPLSKVISPFKLESYVQPGNDGKVFIDLIDENGTTLFHDVRIYQDLPRLWAPVNMDLAFNIESAVEYSRLQIYTEDQYHRIVALDSVDIFLQSTGINRIYTNSNLKERCAIHSPAPMSVLSGGSIIINGVILPINVQPVFIELITENGSIIGSKILESLPGGDNPFVVVHAEIPYQVQDSTRVRLTIRQQDDRIPGNVFVCSQEIKLNP